MEELSSVTVKGLATRMLAEAGVRDEDGCIADRVMRQFEFWGGETVEDVEGLVADEVENSLVVRA